jgi:hypothetical protein
MAPVILVGVAGLTLILVLAWSNVSLRGDLVRDGRTLQSLENTVVWNLRLSTLEGAPMPGALADALRPDIGPQEDLAGGQTLLMVYTPSVCLTCLRSGLESIGKSRPRLEIAGIWPHALIGERRRTRESALLLREDGLLTFAMTFVPADMVLKNLPFGKEPGFAETPLYLLLDQDLNVTTVFKADSQRPELLNRWLEVLGSEARQPGDVP